MKTLTIKQLDKKDEEIASTLISLGMSRPVARTLSYLQNGNEATTIELERGTGLRQPEMSIAMKELNERGWISEREEKKPRKGRPNKVYSLKVGFNKIIAELEKQQKKAVDEMQINIKRLKELGSVTPIRGITALAD
ncbi:MAG: MarR family transcriptional regulator [Methanobacterium sp.]